MWQIVVLVLNAPESEIYFQAARFALEVCSYTVLTLTGLVFIIWKHILQCCHTTKVTYCSLASCALWFMFKV